MGHTNDKTDSFTIHYELDDQKHVIIYQFSRYMLRVAPIYL